MSMATELAHALERFLGPNGAPQQKAAVRQMAEAAMEAWRQGLISTPEVLRALTQGLQALQGPE